MLLVDKAGEKHNASSKSAWFLRTASQEGFVERGVGSRESGGWKEARPEGHMCASTCAHTSVCCSASTSIHCPGASVCFPS